MTLPLWLIGAAALSPLLPGRWRALRLFWVAVVYLTFETLLLAVMLGLWLASGFGWRIRSPYFAGIHYDLVQGTLIVFFREARRVLALRIRTDGPHPPRVPDGPVLVMCRHAGPGDSFILMYALLHWYAREPRVVLKNTLAWDPAIDVVLRRIPARFISPNPEVGRGPRVADRGAGDRPRPQRRVRDLPRGRQLHRGPPGEGHRPAAQARPRADGAARGGDDPRAGAPARRRTGGARGRARRRRADGRATPGSTTW